MYKKNRFDTPIVHDTINIVKTTYLTQRVSSLFVSFLLISFISTSLMAQEFAFDHADCKVRMKKTHEIADLPQSDIDTLEELIVEELEKREFVINPFIDNKRLLEDEMYIDWEVDFTKESIYNTCVIGVSLKLSKGQTPREGDPILYSKVIRRRVPRITFDGMERCKLAIKESFIHIPTCKKIGFYGEKK